MLFVLFFLLGQRVFEASEVHISNATDLIAFSNNVSSGASYSGTTVFLDSDLDFSSGLSGEFEPIGKSYDFQGSFDGQGHTVNNLAMNFSFLNKVGLFGYTKDATIRNFVLDFSCSIVSSYSSPNWVYIGGVIGQCKAEDESSIIENVVSMASIYFTGSTDYSLYIGGVAGELYTSNKEVATVRNCANYGSVTHYGMVGYNAHIGGIAGYSNDGLVQNCLNYGTVTHNGITVGVLYAGGILGFAWGTNNIENCISGGKIISNILRYIGSAVGHIESETTNIKHCFWTNDVGNHDVCGNGNPKIDSETSLISFNVTVTDDLNNYNSSWDKWFMLNLNGGNINNLNQESLVVTQKQFPEPVKDGGAFLLWCLDIDCDEKYNPKTTDITEVTELYATWGITVSFDANGGTVTYEKKIITQNSTYGELPTPTRIGYNFMWWYNSEGEKITPTTVVTTTNCHTLIAKWTPNNYTVTFDFGNGTRIEKQAKYNETISYPDNLTREGHIFIGWDKDIMAMPAEDIIITALWIEMPSSSSTSQKGDNEGDKDKKGGTYLILIVGITVPLVLIIAVFSVVTFVLFKKNREIKDYTKRNVELNKPLINSGDNERRDCFYNSSRYSCVVVANCNEMDSDNIDGRTLNSLFRIYPPSFVKPTMKEALLKAKLSEEQAYEIAEACKNSAEYVKIDGKLFDGFTEEDAAAIAMYTYDFGPGEFENNPYRIINRSLVGRNYAGLQRVSGILYLVITALRKLPRVTGMYLYRGVRSEVNLGKDHYHEGNTITWPALSSTSPDMKATKTFLAKGSKTGKATGTLFIIEDGWGYDIQPYSLFPEEAEILLEPERQFKVKSIIEAEGITIVTLKMLDTPLALQQVFGEGKNNNNKAENATEKEM